MRGAFLTVAQRAKLGLTEEQSLDDAWRRVVATNPLPASVGRICPHPCERHCNRNEKDDSVAIAAFERFLGDWGIARELALPQAAPAQSTSKSVAVVGAGPAGLSCAYQLARRGHAVAIFETYPRPGGMLRYGVPSHRLARGVLDAEIGRLLRLGVVLNCGVQIGGTIAFEELRRTHDAVFVAIGAHRGRRLEVPGSHGDAVFSGVEFLSRVNTDPEPFFGPRVVVVGDGQTAVDVARVANRAGRAAGPRGLAVTLLRAHTRAEENLDPLSEEGIVVTYEVAPFSVERDASGRATGVRVRRVLLGEPNEAGIRLPTPVDGDSSYVPADTVIAAVSQYPDWDGLGFFPTAGGERSDSWGRTSVDSVWAGGDDLLLGTAADSVSQGLRAALSIDAHLLGTAPAEPVRRQPVSTGRVKLRLYDASPRALPHRLTTQESLGNFWAEIEQGLGKEQALHEASRCLSCGVCFGCERCWMFCTPGCFTKASRLSAGEPFMTVQESRCDGCRKCADECPTGFLEMQ